MKVLQVIGSMDRGGAQNLLMNIYLNIDRNKYEFDFLVFKHKKYDYSDMVKQLGGNIIYMPSPTEIGMFNFINQFKHICKKNKYDIVHAHTLFNCGPCMLGAFLAGIKTRISHSHSTKYLEEQISFKKRIYYFLSKLLINVFSNHYIACGKDAGNFLYYKWKKIIVLNNGIDIGKFAYNTSNRNKIRNKYNIHKNDILIGHVGRLMYIKNQTFLLDLIYKLGDNYKLMLVGGGEDEKKLNDKISQLNIQNRVILTGDVNNANEFYSAFDFFCFPSLHEGIPYTVIEAQANGLTIIASDNISKECDVTNSIKFQTIKDIKKWIDFIESSNLKRIDNSILIENSGYSIKSTVNVIENLYNINKKS